MKIFAILLIVFMIIVLSVAPNKKSQSRVKRQYLKTGLNSASSPVNPAQTNVYVEHGQGGVAGKAND
ncbi:hypothetical protein Ddc_13408 [Ditylenchus destructor]|nr:hypothetical protein Ddc_13408 [Ditylenchus destructor]